MITHLMVGTNNLEKSRAFYDAIFGAFGLPKSNSELPRLHYHIDGGPHFLVVTPLNQEPATFANGGVIGFAARNPGEVDAFHAAGLANGGTCEGPPGVREQSPGQLYMAYLRDPDGNKICANSKQG